MTTQPVPQWAVDAAKALALADRDALNCERVLSMSEAARIIAAHAPQGNEDVARLDWLDDNASYKGGGNGGTYSFTTPADVECGMIRAAIDAARKNDL